MSIQKISDNSKYILLKYHNKTKPKVHTKINSYMQENALKIRMENLI